MELRAPKIVLTASNRIDFPAPVSPVSTLKPLENSIFTCSIKAKL